MELVGTGGFAGIQQRTWPRNGGQEESVAEKQDGKQNEEWTVPLGSELGQGLNPCGSQGREQKSTQESHAIPAIGECV